MKLLYRRLQNLIWKSAHFMKPSQQDPGMLGSSAFKQISPSSKLQVQTEQKHVVPFMIPCFENEDKQVGNDDGRFSMSELCSCFLESHRGMGIHKFTTQQLLEEFKVKQRRIYDLMNILEGCGCVERISKGTYVWRGEQNQAVGTLEDQSGDSTSLRYISLKLRKILCKSQKPLTFNQLNQLLIKQTNPKNVNPASIRRRIYQCCKVFGLLGYITKHGKSYYSSKNIFKPLTSLPPFKKYKEPQFQKKIIQEILKKYKTLENLQNLFTKIRFQFQFKYKNNLSLQKEQIISEC